MIQSNDKTIRPTPLSDSSLLQCSLLVISDGDGDLLEAKIVT